MIWFSHKTDSYKKNRRTPSASICGAVRRSLCKLCSIASCGREHIDIQYTHTDIIFSISFNMTSIINVYIIPSTTETGVNTVRFVFEFLLHFSVFRTKTAPKTLRINSRLPFGPPASVPSLPVAISNPSAKQPREYAEFWMTPGKCLKSYR